MELKKVIVILYGKEKHELIAAGIKSHLQNHSKNYDIVMIDDEAFSINYSQQFKRKFYAFCQRNANYLYKLYSSIDEKRSMRFFNKQRHKLQFEEKTGTKGEKLKERVSYVRNIFIRFNPIAVVCMTPNALRMSVIVRDIYKYDSKIVAYMADFGIDLRFLDLRCDKYFVANQEVRKRIMKYGIGEDKIIVTGVPYALNIKEQLDKARCKKEFNIENNEPVVVLSGGKYGCLRIIDDFKKILDSICNFNFIALTGGNKKLYALMKTMNAGDKGKNLQILESADMKKLLTIADIFVTVPTTENVLSGLIHSVPVIAINPLAMVEKRNYSYFKDSGIARTSRNAHITSLTITELLLEVKEREKVLKAAEEYLTGIKNVSAKKVLALMEGNNDTTHSDV